MPEHFVISCRFMLKLLGLVFVVALLALMNVSDVHKQSLNKVLKIPHHLTNYVILNPIENNQEIVDASKWQNCDHLNTRII
jgi:hypothetical protein